MIDQIFPTIFACTLGEETKLMVKHGKDMDRKKYIDRQLMMQGFQQMAMSVPFDDCLIAFHGVKITEKQNEALRAIHKSTRPWALGHASTVLLNRLQSGLTSGKDAKDITMALVEHLTPDGEGGGNKSVGRGSYTVNLYPDG